MSLTEIPKITDYQRLWRNRGREFILPARTNQAFLQEGVDQAAAIQPLIEPTDTVLEYGSGVGRVIGNIRASRKYGLDVNRRFLRQMPSDVEPILSNGLSINLPDETIDFAFSIMVLQHCTKEHHRHIMSEIVRVLRPGGKAWLQFPEDTSYYTQTPGTNVYTKGEIGRYVPSEGVSFSIEPGALAGYADGATMNREWILILQKG